METSATPPKRLTMLPACIKLLAGELSADFVHVAGLLLPCRMRSNSYH